MESERLCFLISLAYRAGLPISDVISDITSSLENSEARIRIINNLEKIQKAVFNIPRDLDKKEVLPEFEYERPYLRL